MVVLLPGEGSSWRALEILTHGGGNSLSGRDIGKNSLNSRSAESFISLAIV
jgi:hypothetical protein